MENNNLSLPDYGSESSLKKFLNIIQPIAGKDEVLKVEYIKGVYFAFGSELACLRLHYKYNLGKHNPKAEAMYSIPKSSWFFCLEV